MTLLKFGTNKNETQRSITPTRRNAELFQWEDTGGQAELTEKAEDRLKKRLKNEILKYYQELAQQKNRKRNSTLTLSIVSASSKILK